MSEGTTHEQQTSESVGIAQLSQGLHAASPQVAASHDCLRRLLETQARGDLQRACLHHAKGKVHMRTI